LLLHQRGQEFDVPIRFWDQPKRIADGRTA
jgi:hypothetical protein